MKQIPFILIIFCLALTACEGSAPISKDVPTATATVTSTTPPNELNIRDSAPGTTDPAALTTEPVATVGTGTPTLQFDSTAALGWKLVFSAQNLECKLFPAVGHGENVLTTDPAVCNPQARYNGALDGSVHYGRDIVPLTATAAPSFLTPFPELTPENILANALGFQIFPQDFAGQQWAWVQAGINQIIFKYTSLLTFIKIG